MAAGVFTVEEIRLVGQATADRDPGGTGERFEWTSDRATDNAQGGARACPKGPMNLGGRLIHVRTDYPGGRAPTEQILGAAHKDLAFEGEWNDRWNFPGYAVRELARFEAMAWRGNRVRVAFQDQAFEGTIVDWDFPYRGRWDVRYRFTVAVAERVGDGTGGPLLADVTFGLADAAPTPEEARAMAVRVAAELEAALGDMPRGAVGLSLCDDVDGIWTRIGDATARVSAAVEGSDPGRVAGLGLEAVDSWRRIGAHLRSLAQEAAGLLDALAEVRSDVTIGQRSISEFFRFEGWSRWSRAFAREMRGEAARASVAMDERARPKARRVYRPQSGESLYAISQRFYGTPHAWTTIARRNRLTSPVLVGGEDLVIPEGPEA